jgi:translocation and assembly module TamB
MRARGNSERPGSSGSSGPVNPRPRAPWARRLAWGGAALLGLGLLALVTLDFWAPPAAEAWLGGTSSTERRVEPGRAVEWRDFAWEKDGLRFAAARLRVDSPLRLLRERRLGAEAEGWVLTLPAGDADPASTAAEPVDAVAGGTWEKWIPALREAGRVLTERVSEVTLREGMVRVGDEQIAVERVVVRDGRIEATLSARGQTADLALHPAEASATARWREGAVELRARAEDERAEVVLEWAGNTARAEAALVAGRWLPGRFRIEGEDWRVPADLLRLGGVYEDLRGRFVVEGDGATARVELSARARPRQNGLPEVSVALAGEGAPDRFRLERLLVEAPQAEARLSAPVEWTRGAGWSVEGESEPEFSWRADLAALSGDEVRGSASGTARWLPGAGGGSVRWAAEAAGLAWGEFPAAALSARGESSTDATMIDEAESTLVGGSRARLSGRAEHGTWAVSEARLAVDLRGDALRPWLPDETKIGRIEAELRGGGRWPEPQVEGELTFTDLAASGWAAERLVVRGKVAAEQGWEADFSLTRGAAELKGFGAGHLRKGGLGGLTLRRGDGRELVSKGFAGWSWVPGEPSLGLDLAGEGGEALRVLWHPAGDSVLRIRELDTTWLADWLEGAPLPRVSLRAVDASGGFDPAGILRGRASFDLGGETRGGVAVWARGAGRLDDTGASLEKFEAGQGGVALAGGAGRLPWRLRGGVRLAREPVPGGVWDLRLESRVGAEWWEELAKAADLTIEEPSVSLRAFGPAEAPRGQVELAAARVGLRGQDLPEGGLDLHDFRVEADLAPEEIVLRHLAAKIDGQAFAASARLPLAPGDWPRLRARPYVWLRDHAEARISLPGAEVAALARYLPALLAPQGVLAAELRLEPGARLEGTVDLRGAATRPLGGFGVLQEVEVALALSGMEVRIETLRAMAGGQPLVVSGGARRVPGKLPALDLVVKAERFPLVRKPGLLMRGDLDLTVKTAEDGRTRVGGEVRLRDSLFLADVRPLIARRGGGGPEVPRARPPYFSVDTAPLADWELALRVGGERFLRVRMPVFEGLGSARFDLSGTMREPRAVGEFRVERGNILFPFASFAVQEGTVRLREADPYTAALDFRATGRRLGYDLRLELEGTVDEPRLQIYSSPPLDAERVLLMVTAGQSPTQGVGGSSGTQRLAAVGAYVGRDFLRTLGFAGTDEERLTISSGEKVSRQGRETYGFDLRLNERWSLTGEYDEFDSYNIGVRRRWGPEAPDAGEEKK